MEVDATTGDELPQLRQELFKTKVDAFFKAVATETGLFPENKEVPPYDEFELEEATGTLYLKDGDRRVRNELEEIGRIFKP